MDKELKISSSIEDISPEVVNECGRWVLELGKRVPTKIAPEKVVISEDEKNYISSREGEIGDKLSVVMMDAQPV